MLTIVDALDLPHFESSQRGSCPDATRLLAKGKKGSQVTV
jgi:hypothetical protein